MSGGKDSTCMMLEMLERGESIHSAVFFDTCWEFPSMYEHIEKLEEYTGVKIWHLHSRFPFDYWLTARPVIARDGPKKGQVHRIGNGWPSLTRRWCTREKIDTINLYVKPIENAVSCIGYAADEKDRQFCDEKIPHRFPLVEYGITEKQALGICKSHGFDWNGLYDHFSRASCFCCPLKRLGELRVLRHEYTDLWQRMLEMDESIPNNRGFRADKTVHDLENRFTGEDRQEVMRLS